MELILLLTAALFAGASTYESRKTRKALARVRKKQAKLEATLAFQGKISNDALNRAMDAHIRVGAIEKSTHTMVPVSVPAPGGDMGNIEEMVSRITGQGREDMESDLVANGFGEADDPEDQV